MADNVVWFIIVVDGTWLGGFPDFDEAKKMQQAIAQSRACQLVPGRYFDPEEFGYR